MEIRLIIIALLTTFCMLPCCAQKNQHGKTGMPQKHQHGKASFYSKKATGARSASGQKIHHDSLTCAHRYYPFGTHLKVTNLSNGKSVIVKVIDRGPYGRGRIIDLSWAAAKEIGMIAQGVGTVKVERIDNPIPYRPEETKLPKIDFEMAEFEPKNYFEKKEERKKTQALHQKITDNHSKNDSITTNKKKQTKGNYTHKSKTY